MKLNITYQTSKDYTYENIIVTKDGKEIFQVSTSDSPEDNNLSRMGVLENVESLIKEMGGKVEIIKETV